MRRLLLALLDVTLLAANLATGGPVAATVRGLVLGLVITVCALLMFLVVLLILAALSQRQPPYPF